MKSKILVCLFTIMLAGLTSVANAASVTVKFDNIECPTCINTVPVNGDEWNAFGLTVSNAYWYTDSRDTFDTMGLSINNNPAAISLTTVSNGVKFDFFVVDEHTSTYKAFDSAHNLLGSFFVDVPSGDVLGSYSFNGPVASLEWTGSHGYASISTLTISPIPEPGTYAMLLVGLGILGFVARYRKQNA